MRSTDLEQKGMKSIFIEGTQYFYVEDIKENFKDLKIDIKEIFYHEEIPLIRARFVQEKTEFDLMMEKALNKDKK